MAGMAGMAVRQKEWQNSRMAEMATYVLFMVHTNDSMNNRMAELRNGGMVIEWWSCGMAEWWNGGIAEWRNGGMAEWRNGGMVIEWRNGGMVIEWRNGGMAEWWNGGMA